MLGWSVPRRIGRPGVVTSTVSAARRAVELAAAQTTCRARRAPPRSPSGRCWRRRRPAAGPRPAAPPMPAQDARQPTLLAEDVELERVERRGVRGGRDRASASRCRASRSRVRSARSTLFLGCWGRARGIMNPRASRTSRVPAADRAGRAVVRRPSPPRRCDRTSRCRGPRGRPGSCDRARCRRCLRPLMNWP